METLHDASDCCKRQLNLGAARSATAAPFSPFMFQAPPTIYGSGDSIEIDDPDEYQRLLACGAIVNPAVQVVPGPGGLPAVQIVPAS